MKRRVPQVRSWDLGLGLILSPSSTQPDSHPGNVPFELIFIVGVSDAPSVSRELEGPIFHRFDEVR
jgi:hypothetical protein